MNSIVLDAIGTAPTNLTKVQLARYINSKWNVGWEKAHYHAMLCVLTRVEARIREMFLNLIGEEPDDQAMKALFERSLSHKYDYVNDWIDVRRIDSDIVELININIKS